MDIIGKVSSYIPSLKKESGGEYKGLCPFHRETKPSFSINARSGLWYCHGCQRGGSANKLLRELGITETINTNFEYTPKSDKPTRNQVAENLLQNSTAPIYGVFLERGISRDAVDKAGIRRIPIKTAEEFAYGAIMSMRERFGYLQYIHLFPLFYDGFLAGGQLYAGRSQIHTLTGSRLKHLVYNLTDDRDYCYIVESMIDALSLVTYGHPAIAMVNASCNTYRIDQIPKHIKQVVLMYDNDRAGRDATTKTTPLLKGINYRIYRYKGKFKDPNEMLEKGVKL